MIYGRLARGNKFKSQDPELVGPFHITPTLSWQEFMDALADTTEVTKNSILVEGEGLKWRFQGKNAKLPLKDEMGFSAMKAQLTSHKDPDSAILIVTLPTNTYNNCQKAHAAPTGPVAITAKISHGQQRDPNDGTLWGEKVSNHCIDYIKRWY